MKTPLVIVLVIVVAMLGFLTIYSQQSGDALQAQSPTATGDGSAAVASGGNVSAAPAATEATAAAPAPGGK